MDQPPVYEGPDLTKVLHQSRTRTRRLWTQNKLRKGLGGGSPPMNDTPHHGLFSYTIGETKNREITHHMFHPINQKEKKHFTTVHPILSFGAERRNCCIDYRGREKPLTAAMQHSLLQNGREGLSKQNPPPPGFTNLKQLVPVFRGPPPVQT